MKKIICKKEYDTETATLIQKYTVGSFGDPAGYEESLFQTPEGLYFIYGVGGEASIYPTEDIQRLAKTKVKEWKENHKFHTYEKSLLWQALFSFFLTNVV